MQTSQRAAMLAALFAGSAHAAGASFPPLRDYGAARPPTGKRQGARLERQMARGLLDFSASEKCLARIRAKLAT